MDGKFVFFGGKGGVGKTTVSSAFGLRCARAGERTLLVSTDPAHSTGDVFDQPFGDTPQQVEGHENLYALEIDPEAERERHLSELRRELTSQMSAVVVNEVSVQLEMAHQTPGAHEAALFDRFIQVMSDAEEFDRVVFDTSPTGSTLRLLALPDLLEGWIERLHEKREQSLKMYERAAIGNLPPRRSVAGDPILERLEQRRSKFQFARETLTDDAAFVLVMNPDELSLRETERALETYDEYGLDVVGIVINRLTPAPEPHEDGRGARYLRQRCESERERVETVRESFREPIVATIETRVREIKDDLLDDVVDELDLESPAAAADTE